MEQAQESAPLDRESYLRWEAGQPEKHEYLAGEVFAMGSRHELPGLDHALEPARPLADEAALPYYLAAGVTVRRHVRAGQLLRVDDVDLSGGSNLLRLRKAQDQRFFGPSRKRGGSPVRT